MNTGATFGTSPTDENGRCFGLAREACWDIRDPRARFELRLMPDIKLELQHWRRNP